MAFLGMAIFSVTARGVDVAEPLYNVNEATTIRPKEYKVRGSNLSLFPVPQDNAIGTNDMGNAITLLSFQNGRLSKDKYFRNAAHDFEGGGTYLPVIDENTIGLAQSRRFLLFDFKEKECRDYRIVMSLEKTIEKVAIADAQKKHFIFEIQAHNPMSEDPWDFNNQLMLIDLSEKEPKMIKEMNIGSVTAWSMICEKLLLYNLESEKMQVFTKNFEPSKHSLAAIISQNRGKISFVRTAPHPYSPFAILSGGTEGSTYVYWGEDRETRHIPLIECTTQFSFSPDGKWVVFQKDFPEPKQTYLMPVSEKYPNYLGSPILLANDYYDSGHFAWTTNPISFVGSSLDKLYRWELTNEAHPESDKPTFHDYIVENDLRKLTWEKRQGLGEKPE
jgi:hypothetical protein